ncbi:putative bifunctional diguanylate cyclase/phosphodiesterase [Klenkia terrae]|uniref:Bifunctional diguanylate cyclase/phosphodiesterase n=1 Tax=Klenkia terrae TaxID=1052259 RepID=A0ABU8E806_9ACTN|nr:bifunctional diguanylate cyclase/phosphodiesterase [Klenkia terrae]
MTAPPSTAPPVVAAPPLRRPGLHRATSGRVLRATAVVLVAWAAVLATTPAQAPWRVALDVAVLGGVHGLAALVALRDRQPGSPGAVPRTALGVGLAALAVAAVAGRLSHPEHRGPGTWVLDGLHLTGQLGVAVLLLSLVLPLRGRLVVAGLGLDAVSTTLGLSAVAGTVVLIGIGDDGTDLATRVVLVLTGVDVVLVAGAVALFSVLRPSRHGVVLPVLLGAALVLAADLTAGYSVHRGGALSPPAAYLLTAAACLALAAAVTRPVGGTAAVVPLGAVDRLRAWSTVLPFAGTGANLLALVISAVAPVPAGWALLQVLAAAGCLGVVAIRFQVTVRVARTALEQLEDAFTDPLTRLPNRRGLAARVDHWLVGPEPVTVLAVDLDGFRRINEEAGHETGDRVLQRVAAQLTELAAPGTVVARIDGDDYALAFLGDDPARASLLAAQVRDVLGRPFDLDRHRLHLTVNVGTAVSHLLRDALGGSGGPSTDGLLRCADQALAQAQASTSGTAVHDAGSCSQTTQDSVLAWVDDLHAALAADDQLLLHFQPQHRIAGTGTGSVATVVGCEALLRWAHPTRGLLGPGEVLRAAEHGHLSDAVTERVLDLALHAAAGWWADREVPVAVNLSATDLDDELLPHRIADALDRHGLPARALTVEVVEDTLMLDPDRALQTLTALRSIGLRIAVDDYGTGYSSLAYLHRLPIDEVKFDRSLTAGISADPAAAVIVGHSIRLAHDLGLSALAEGIEEPADLELLHRLGCDAVQGWLTGHPLPVHGWVGTLDLGLPLPRS